MKTWAINLSAFVVMASLLSAVAHATPNVSTTEANLKACVVTTAVELAGAAASTVGFSRPRQVDALLNLFVGSPEKLCPTLYENFQNAQVDKVGPYKRLVCDSIQVALTTFLKPNATKDLIDQSNCKPQ